MYRYKERRTTTWGPDFSCVLITMTIKPWSNDLLVLTPATLSRFGPTPCCETKNETILTVDDNNYQTEELRTPLHGIKYD